MAKITSPRGEVIHVKRRWFPWPNLSDSARLEKMGMASSAAKVLGKNNLADVALTVMIALVYLIILMISPLFFMVAVALLIVFLIVRFLGLPWRIEISHEGVIVESEESEGFSQTTSRILKVAALYESGALKLPTPKETTLRTKATLPLPGTLPGMVARADHDGRPTLSQLPKEEKETPPVQESALPSLTPPEAPLFSVFDDEDEEVELPTAVFDEDPQVSTPLKEAEESRPHFTGESPLRRAIRMMEEEEKELRRMGVKESSVSGSAVRKAKVKKSFFRK